MIQAHLKVAATMLKRGVLYVDLDVLEHPGKRLSYTCTIEHTNPAIQQFGMARLHQLVAGCGLAAIHDSDQLHGKVCIAWINGDKVHKIIPRVPDPVRRPGLVQRLFNRLFGRR